MIKSADEIYEVVERTLRGVTSPMTCAAMMENPSVREAALNRWGSDVQVATNKLSDTLGYMWRRGIVDRFSAPPSRSMARFAYTLKNATETPPMIKYGPAVKLDEKQTLSIQEKDGEVILEFQNFTIRVIPK